VPDQSQEGEAPSSPGGGPESPEKTDGSPKAAEQAGQGEGEGAEATEERPEEQDAEAVQRKLKAFAKLHVAELEAIAAEGGEGVVERAQQLLNEHGFEKMIRLSSPTDVQKVIAYLHSLTAYERELPIGPADFAAMAAVTGIASIVAGEAVSEKGLRRRLYGGALTPGVVLNEGFYPLAHKLYAQLSDHKTLAVAAILVVGGLLAKQCQVKRQKLHKELTWDWTDEWAKTRGKEEVKRLLNPQQFRKPAMEHNATTAVLVTLAELRRTDDQPSPAGRQYMCEWRFLLGGEAPQEKKGQRVRIEAPKPQTPGFVPMGGPMGGGSVGGTAAPAAAAAAGVKKEGEVEEAAPEVSKSMMPTPTRAVEAWGRTSWRAMEQGRVEWKEWFALFQVELPRAPVHPSSRKFVEFFFFERDKRKGDKGPVPYFSHVKVQLLFDNERRKRASLPFVSQGAPGATPEDASRGRFVFDIELQLKENPMRPSEGQHVFPLRRGTQGPVLEGPAAYFKMEDLPAADVSSEPTTETDVTTTAAEQSDRCGGTTTDHTAGGGRKKRKKRGFLSGSKRAEETSASEAQKDERKGPRIKTCIRCRMKYAEEFNGDESCPRGKHWGRLVWEPGLVARNVALCAATGIAIGGVTGAAMAWYLSTPPPFQGLHTAGYVLSASQTALNAAEGKVVKHEAFMDHWHGFRRYIQSSIYVWGTNTAHPALVGATWGAGAGILVGGVLAAQKYARCDDDGKEVPSAQQSAEWAAAEKEDKDNLAAGVYPERASTKKEMDDDEKASKPQKERDEEALWQTAFLHAMSGYRWNCCDAPPYVGFCTGKTRHRSVEDDEEEAEAEFLKRKKAEEERRAEEQYEQERKQRAEEKERARYKAGEKPAAEPAAAGGDDSTQGGAGP